VKLLGIGELFIPHQHIRRGFAGFVEKEGSGAYDPPEYIREAVRDADIIVTEFCPIGKALIDECANLAVIGVLRAGIENVDVAHATAKGILVYNTFGRNADSVADFTVGLLIAECRNIARGHHGLKNGRWIREYPNSGSIPDLPGKTVGIVGLGEIGRKVARRLAGFDVRILAHDPFVKEPPDGVAMTSLEQLMAESDFVTIHARLGPETEKLIGLWEGRRSRFIVNGEVFAAAAARVRRREEGE
jgi:D-3-phosphoglycerate dehydrogenase